MCGLVGIAGAMTATDDRLIKRLLIHDYFRGPDSSGLASIRGDGTARIAKLASDPITLFEHNKFKHAIEGISRVYMGHNRAATRGLVNNYNAHPFEYDHVVGAHNGTLDQLSWYRLEEAIGEKFAVDSQALIAAIAKLGIKKAIELCTEGKDPSTGAWALSWYDFNEGSLNFLRNKHRPMWYSYSKDYRRLFYASEWWMIEAAVRAENVELASEGKEGFKFFPTEDDIHYKFDVGLLMTAISKVKPKTKTIKGREPLPVAVTGGGDPFGRSGTGCGGNVHQHRQILTRELTANPLGTTSSPGTTRRSPTPDNVLHWLGTPTHPLAGYVDKEKFTELAKYGCSWCQCDVAFGDAGVTIFERDDLLLCGACSGYDEIDDDTPNRIYIPGESFNALRT
jgi:predicted glutamine amidotransferase